MKSCFCLLIAVCCLSSGCSQTKIATSDSANPIQTQISPSPNQATSLHESQLSPENIADYISQNSPSLDVLWQRLKINSTFPGKKAEQFDFTVNQGDKIALIRVTNDFDAYRYMFFKLKNTSTKPAWEFYSYFDLMEQRYGPPEQKMEVAGDYFWFVVQVLEGRGSDLSWFSTYWYSLRTKEAKVVLAASDHREGSSFLDPVITDKWQVLKQNVTNGIYTVTFLSIFSWGTFTDTKKLEELFTRENRMAYVWNPKRNKFLFNRSSSTTTERELNRVYIKWDSGFVRSPQLYFRELAKIASHGTQKQKEWLIEYLKKQRGDSYKKRLMKMLND